MNSDSRFNPDWISPPGDTITAVLVRRGIDEREFALRINRPLSDALALMSGQAQITSDVAHQLAAFLGSTQDFWIRREARYRQALNRLHSECTTADSAEWLSEVPAKEMVKLGWMNGVQGETELIAACLQFFGVSSLKGWEESYKKPLEGAFFRTSPSFTSGIGAVAAWLRQGEVAASPVQCGSWDRDKFSECLPQMRALTRVKSPAEFVPALVDLCAGCGVALAVVRAPKNCRASGACRFLSASRPLILLSARYLSDDHFWFTFFHEAAHLLLHADRMVFVDELEEQVSVESHEEAQANEFASNVLIPAECRRELLAMRPHKMAVMRFAKEIGVSRGIVVGQLQHRGVIRRNQLNSLKRRYSWNSDNSLVLNP